VKRDGWIALALASVFLLRRSRVIPWGDNKLWTVPVPDMKIRATGVLYPARISNGFAPPRHAGVDLMYARRVAGDQPSYPPGTHDGSPRFFCPSGTPVVAARAGVVWSADHSARGWQVVLDHGKPFATYYQHLDRITVPECAGGKVKATGKAYAVAAGDVIGFVGFDPTDPEGLRHLHFAVWYQGAGDNASVDPTTEIDARWQRATWTV
jgi:murein DD-endopeptidase MepM/ murein hydrolase activator NlpD